MASSKLSTLAAVTTLADSDELYVNDALVSKRITRANLRTSMAPDAATTTAEGIIEIATGAETNTGTDATRAVSPDGLDDWTGSAQVTTVGVLASPVLTTPQINDTSADHQYVVAVNELVADRTVTLPLLGAADEFVFKDHAVTLANKTFTAPVLGTPASGNLSNCTAYPGDASLVTVGALDTGSITANFGNIDIGASTFATTGTLAAGVGTLTSLNLTADTNQIVLDSDAGVGVTTTITDSATAARTVTLPDADGTLIYSGGAFHDGFSDFVANEHIDHTGVTITIAATANETTVAEGAQDISASRTFTVGIADDPILPGTGGVEIPQGTTAQRLANEGALRVNTTTGTTEIFRGAAWVDLEAGGGIASVAADATPQLGGNLDVNGNSIVSAAGADIAVTPDTTGDVILDGLKWPQADGTNGQVLKTDGAAQLSWTAAGAGDLLANGTIPLSANWDVGAFTITGTQFISDIATGTAPFVVSSTTEVANLQAATVGTIAGLAPDTATTQATQAAITTAANLVTVGALDAGSITANFGAIDNGTSNVTTGGILKVDVDGTATNAAGSLTFGAGNDCSAFFDGTNLVLEIKGGNSTTPVGYQITQEFTAGEAVVDGDLCYLKSDGKMWETDASAVATAKGQLVIAMATIAADATGKFLVKGSYTTTGLTQGSEYYISETKNNITATAPVTASAIVRIVGWAQSTTVLNFDPDGTYIEI